MDAFAVAEFLACFGTLAGTPQLNLVQLQAAVAWPLDGPELSNIYIALVKYLLAQWVSEVCDTGVNSYAMAAVFGCTKGQTPTSWQESAPYSCCWGCVHDT